MSASESKKIVLKKLSKLGTTWHPDSTCVFKAPGTTKKDRVVIGRWVDDELIPLDEDAMALCEEWDFKPDESLLADASEEEQSEGGEEASPEEEEEEEGSPEEEEEQEDGKEEQKEEPVPEPVQVEKVVPKSKNVSGSTSVKRVETLTSELTKNIMEVVNDLQSQIDSLTVELGNKTKECEELQGKYDAINQKFTAMKSLFN
jgi:hypothetical protein